MRVLARLVVLDDPSRAEGVDVDAVDLSGECQPFGELEPALQLRRRALRAEQHLKAARDERRFRRRVFADERLEVSPETVLELALLQLGELHPDAFDRRV